MKRDLRPFVFILLSMLFIACIAFFKRMPQSLSYHDFADKRIFLGVPNFANVITNLPFLLIGIYGLSLLARSTAERAIKIEYGVLFTGIVLIGIGSAYYHYSPDNETLVWDRIPMTIVFMGLLSTTISEFVSTKVGLMLLIPLVVIGIGSVAWWHLSERNGAGDLRLYGLVQFYPVFAIAVILFLYRSQHNKASFQLVWVIIWYAVAKLCEHYDQEIYAALQVISGHSIKHLAAAVSTWYLVRLFTLRHVAITGHQLNTNA